MSEHNVIADMQIASLSDQASKLATARNALMLELEAEIYGTLQHIDITRQLSQVDLLLREIQHVRSQWIMAKLTRRFISAARQI